MKWYFMLFLGIFIFGSGWMIGLFVEHWALFNLSFDVPAFSIINLLVISTLAWYINYSIQNENRKKQSKIDLLSNKIDEIDANLKRIVELCLRDNGASYVEICNLDKRNRAWAKMILNVLEEKYSGVCDKNKYITLIPNLTSLRKLVTTTTILINGNTPEVAVANSIVRYSGNRKAEIEILAESIRHDLYQVKVSISQK